MKMFLLIQNKMDFALTSMLWATFLLLLLSRPLLGLAQQKKTLSENDYSRWGSLDVQAISDKGKWASYAMRYDSGMDTLFVHNTTKNKSYAFPKGHDGLFGAEKVFAFLVPESNLKVMQLETGQVKHFDHVERYELTTNGHYIITFDKGYSQKSVMIIRNQNGAIVDTLANVTEHSLNSTKDALLFTSNSNENTAVGIIQFNPYSRSLISKNKKSSSFNLMWQYNSKAVVFLNEKDTISKKTTLNYFRIADKKIFTLDPSKMKKKGFEIYKRTSFSISEDGSKVFFMVASENKSEWAKKSNDVEIWKGSDKWLYIDRQRQHEEGDIPNVAVWYPDTGNYFQINNDDLPKLMLSGQQEYAISYNKFSYGLQSKYYEEVDFYLTNLKDNSKKLILEKQSCDPEQIGFDPYNNNILYYSENNWWIYTPESKKHINLTQKVITHWDNNSTIDAPHQFMVYGNPGWSSDGKNVLLYDANDIWLVAIDGSNCTRLTKGREQNIVFRITQIEYGEGVQLNFDGRNPVIFDISKDLLLEAKNSDNWSTGYYLYNQKSGANPLVYGPSKIDKIKKSKNGNYIFQNQTFSQSPRLEFRNKNHTVSKILFASNKQQIEYYYPKSELLHYVNSKGQKLKAALFYPAHYDTSKKYPMVVNIYDVLSNYLYHYVNPSFLNREGFNVTNYTLNDYFVLLPDIKYETGNPGSSAVDCVLAGVNAVVSKGLVDAEKIGLYGHSFGGYETNFIISQTTIFAAAVAGAGVSDIISKYFNISRNAFYQTDMWRFENQQFRIGKSLYEDKEAYVRNSPIMYAENVQTPLLLWTGKDDKIIPWNQSITYYLALRKLGVTCDMLVYPDEGHSLENSINQTDLSKRMMAWFDHLLKGKSTPEWVMDSLGTE
jgi:dipeptidyl aminopeptidase/acylaminoacyl peptidase